MHDQSELINSDEPETATSAHKSHTDGRNVGKICSSNCGFPIVKLTARKYGMIETGDEWGQWTLYWTDRFPNYERCRLMKRHQKLNHIPGMLSICRKDELAKNLNRMLKFFPKQYDFFPKTWVLPGELNGLLDYANEAKEGKIFILKPSRGSLGRGIYLTKTIEHLDLLKMMIGQVYIHRPFLIDGFKFDLRLYVLVASCNPLRVYVYNEGLARFATRKYEPSSSNLHLKYMHLTNYSVNRYSSTYNTDVNDGSKRKLTTIYEWMEKHNYNAKKVWSSIDDVIVKTILVALPHMRYNSRMCFPSHVDTVPGFELLGFDFILDSKLKPYLLEVNHTPSFTRCTPLDREVKDQLIYDVFNILNLAEDETLRIQNDEKSFLHDRLVNRATARAIERARHQQVIKQKEIWESEHLGNFRKVFPVENVAKYKPFLRSLLVSSFHQDELADNSARKSRRNPYEFSPTETNTSDTATMRKLLLTSYQVFDNLHKEFAQAAQTKLMTEISDCRTNSWDDEEKFANLYTSNKTLLAEGMKSVLKFISKRADISTEDKEKLSAVFLDPPTFLPEDRKSCVDLSEEDEAQTRQVPAPVEPVPHSNTASRITNIELLDFIPGAVLEDKDRYEPNKRPIYSIGPQQLTSGPSYSRFLST